jgi:hypothetical protein
VVFAFFRAGERLGAPDTQKQRSSAYQDGVPLFEGRAGLLFPVHERRGATHSLHLPGDGGGSNEELPPRDAAAREKALARGSREGLAWTVLSEGREFIDLLVPASDETSLEGQEKGDLADAMRFFGRPEKNEGPGGQFVSDIGRAATGNGCIDHGGGHGLWSRRGNATRSVRARCGRPQFVGVGEQVEEVELGGRASMLLFPESSPKPKGGLGHPAVLRRSKVAKRKSTMVDWS